MSSNGSCPGGFHDQRGQQMRGAAGNGGEEGERGV